MASRPVRIVNLSKKATLADNARVADSFFSRFVGLLGSPPLKTGEGLLLIPCSSIHMIGMSFPIDVVFFDKQMTVVGVVEGIAPGQISRGYPGAHSCLELPCGVVAVSGTAVGDKVEVAST